MIKPKILKTESEYAAALAYVETLMDAAPGSPQEDDLELFSLLIEQYEDEHFPIDLPDPIEAIKFRMDQQSLTRKDLEPYLGGQSKVSEVLNRKRPLSLAMIRALHEGLGIPAEVLLKEPGRQLPARRYHAGDFPFAEMYRRGYFRSFNGSLQDAKANAEELLEKLFSALGPCENGLILCKSSQAEIEENALRAWQAQAITLAEEQELPPFTSEKVTLDFIRDVVRLSYYAQGPLLARERLAKRGIPLVILPHLPHTYLDGASFRTPSGRAVVGLTLRHDRLDNFWFTLAHELAHIHRHLDGNYAFFDDTEAGLPTDCRPEEVEANEIAAEALIPGNAWVEEKETLLSTTNPDIVVEFADRMEISPAIVAGRIRFESKDYTRFSSLIGSRAVRKRFVD